MTDGTDENGRLLARIDERTELMDQKMDWHYREVCKRIDDQEDRLRALEKWRNIGAIAYGAGAAVLAWITGTSQS